MHKNKLFPVLMGLIFGSSLFFFVISLNTQGANTQQEPTPVAQTLTPVSEASPALMEEAEYTPPTPSIPIMQVWLDENHPLPTSLPLTADSSVEEATALMMHTHERFQQVAVTYAFYPANLTVDMLLTAEGTYMVEWGPPHERYFDNGETLIRENLVDNLYTEARFSLASPLADQFQERHEMPVEGSSVAPTFRLPILQTVDYGGTQFFDYILPIEFAFRLNPAYRVPDSSAGTFHVVGPEEILGRQAVGVERRSQIGSTTYWIDADTGIILRVEDNNETQIEATALAFDDAVTTTLPSGPVNPASQRVDFYLAPGEEANLPNPSEPTPTTDN